MQKVNHIQNIKFLRMVLGQNLYKNIDACWYGMGKASEKWYNELNFNIMIAIEKGSEYQEIVSVVLYATTCFFICY